MVYKDFLSLEELAKINVVQPNNQWWVEGTTNDPSDSRVVNTYDITGTFNWLDVKVFSFIKNLNLVYDINKINETKLLKYSPGGKYDWHQDVLWNRKLHRKFTYILQLTDKEEYEGGNFEFRDANNIDMTYSRDKGTIIIFPSILYHRITPIIKGHRRSIVGWVVGPQWK